MESKINEKLVNLNMTAENAIDAIVQLANALYSEGRVKGTFQEAVIKREQTFPTGLPGEVCGVAIPHTDSVHVNQDSFAIGVLRKPVKFKVMGTSDQYVDVSFIVMLAIKSSDEQLTTLQALMALFQDSGKMNELLNSKSEKELVDKFVREVEVR